MSKWSERTIYRVEENPQEESGLELILRLKGDSRKADKEDIVNFLMYSILKLYKDPKSKKSNGRLVAFGGVKQELKTSDLTEAQREMIKNVLFGVNANLSKRGSKELYDYICDLSTKI